MLIAEINHFLVYIAIFPFYFRANWRPHQIDDKFLKVAFWLEMISAFHWRRLELSIFCSFLIIVLWMNFFIFRIRKTAIYGTWKCSPLFQITISLVLIKVSLKMRHHWNQNTVSYWAMPFVLVFRAIYEILGASKKNNLEFWIFPKFCFNLHYVWWSTFPDT